MLFNQMFDWNVRFIFYTTQIVRHLVNRALVRVRFYCIILSDSKNNDKLNHDNCYATITLNHDSDDNNNDMDIMFKSKKRTYCTMHLYWMHYKIINIYKLVNCFAEIYIKKKRKRQELLSWNKKER